jgi:uncharacterized protein YcaQ
MTHHRQNFERVYALTETVAPAHLIRQSSQAEADRFLIKKEISFAGLKPIFLAPLDPVSARGRAKTLFGFNYVWEVYKPEHKRKFGYYTLPILWGDQLVGRFDSKLDRPTNTLIILGFWLEDEALGQDQAFAAALARGFTRFLTFLGTNNLDAKAIPQPLFADTL